MPEQPINATSVTQAAHLLAQGQLVAFATETVYGLGADANNAKAVAAIFARKGRPEEHPLIVHIARPEQAAFFAARIPVFAQRLLQRFWPGPLTLVLPRRSGVATTASGGQTSIGLRSPAHASAQALLQAAYTLGVRGVAAPSANRFGYISPTTAAHVCDGFGPDLPIVDAGACPIGIESTIVDCTRAQPVLLRPGAISRTQLAQTCGEPVYLAQAFASASPKASGTLPSHYAPQTKVVLWEPHAWQTQLQRLGKTNTPENPCVITYDNDNPRQSPFALYCLPAQASAAMHTLFAQLRAMDKLSVKAIWIGLPPNTPEWEGVRDRLQRAAA